MSTKRKMKLQEVEEELNIERYAICQYERDFKLELGLEIEKDQYGHRLFSKEDIELLKEIIRLEVLGLDKDEIIGQILCGYDVGTDEYEKELQECILANKTYYYKKITKEKNVEYLRQEQRNWGYQDTFFPRISEKSFPQYFFSIISLFAEDCNFNLTQCYASQNRMFLSGSVNEMCDECRLLLRYGGDRLIIASVNFIYEREKKMSKLYDILKIMKKEYEVEQICFEGTLTQWLVDWCIKNNFEISFFDEKYLFINGARERV